MARERMQAAAALEDLGFTALEARIYIELLGSGAQSGYRVAQSIGKAAANTYKALDALEARGAVVCQDGDTRLYRAIPYAELSAMLASEFARRATTAERVLSAIQVEANDDRIYRLANSAHVFERARAIVDAAGAFLLVDAFPKALDELRASIEAAAARGVDVIVRTYAPAEVRGARIVQAPGGADVLARWPGSWLDVNSDAAQALVAYVSDDGTVGTWTQNAPLAWILYCGVASETALAHLHAFAEREPALSIRDALRTVEDIVRTDPPGRATLYRQLSSKKENHR